MSVHEHDEMLRDEMLMSGYSAEELVMFDDIESDIQDESQWVEKDQPLLFTVIVMVGLGVLVLCTYVQIMS